MHTHFPLKYFWHFISYRIITSHNWLFGLQSANTPDKFSDNQNSNSLHFLSQLHNLGGKKTKLMGKKDILNIITQNPTSSAWHSQTDANFFHKQCRNTKEKQTVCARDRRRTTRILFLKTQHFQQLAFYCYTQLGLEHTKLRFFYEKYLSPLRSKTHLYHFWYHTFTFLHLSWNCLDVQGFLLVSGLSVLVLTITAVTRVFLR